MDVKKLGNIVMPGKGVFFFERCLRGAVSELLLTLKLGHTLMAADSFWMTERSSARVCK